MQYGSHIFFYLSFHLRSMDTLLGSLCLCRAHVCHEHTAETKKNMMDNLHGLRSK